MMVEGAALPLRLTTLDTGSSHFAPTRVRRRSSDRKRRRRDEGEDDEGRRVRPRPP